MAHNKKVVCGAREQKRCCGPCVQSPWQREPSHIAYRAKSAQPPTIHNARAAGDAQHTQLGWSCALTENAAHRQRQSKSGTGRAARSLTHSPAKRPTHQAPAPVSCMHFSPAPPPPTLSLSAGLFPKGESEFSIFFALGFWLSGIERKALSFLLVSHCAMKEAAKKSLQGSILSKRHTLEPSNPGAVAFTQRAIPLSSSAMRSCVYMFTFISQVHGELRREPRNCIARSLFFIYVAAC